MSSSILTCAFCRELDCASLNFPLFPFLLGAYFYDLERGHSAPCIFTGSGCCHEAWNFVALDSKRLKHTHLHSAPRLPYPAVVPETFLTLAVFPWQVFFSCRPGGASCMPQTLIACFFLPVYLGALIHFYKPTDGRQTHFPCTFLILS